jgi:hypothetical protein
MDLFSGLSDDQFALAGCAIALIVTGGLMSISHFIGDARRKSTEPRRVSYEEHKSQKEQRRNTMRPAA